MNPSNQAKTHPTERSRRYKERQKKRDELRVQKKMDSDFLTEGGWQIRYLAQRTVAVAYKGTDESEITAHFTVRSVKDDFSRPAARAALTQHIKNGTHRFKVQFIPAQLLDGNNKEIVRRSNSKIRFANNEALVLILWEGFTHTVLKSLYTVPKEARKPLKSSPSLSSFTYCYTKKIERARYVAQIRKQLASNSL